MKVLITGATGFIGNHVTRLCVEQGDDVRVMVLPGENLEPLKDLNVEIVEGDLLKPETLANCVQGIEGLYHLAAIYAVWTKDPTLQYRVNVDGARAILRAAMAAGVKKVVFTSSVAAVGSPPDGALADENTDFNGWHYANDYVLSKYISEQMVRGLIGEWLPATIVRPGFPFGPGDRMPTPTGKLIIAILEGKMKHYFEGGLSAVDVRDVARGHVLAMQKGKIGESYILTNKEGNMEQAELARLVGKIAGVPDVATKEVPRWVMGVSARLMESWANLTGKSPMTTYKTSMFAMQKLYFSSDKAVKELGMPQTPIETAIKDAADWFRDNGYVTTT